MSDEKKLSERIKWKAFRLHPADRDSVVVSKATLDRWINEIAALEKRLAEAGWQPIETAPKISKTILIYCAESKNTYTARWVSDKEYPWSGKWHHFPGGVLSEVATHWMPLPPPPQENTHD